MKGILSNIKANVVTLNETNLKGNRKLKIDGFTSYTRNRQKAHMGGIATSIDNKDAPNCLKVNEGSGDDEFIITRHSQFQVPINILNIYGETESRSSTNEIKDRWERIMAEVAKIEMKGEAAKLLVT